MRGGGGIDRHGCFLTGFIMSGSSFETLQFAFQAKAVQVQKSSWGFGGVTGNQGYFRSSSFWPANITLVAVAPNVLLMGSSKIFLRHNVDTWADNYILYYDSACRQ